MAAPTRILYERPKKEKKGDAAQTGVAGVSTAASSAATGSAAASVMTADAGATAAAGRFSAQSSPRNTLFLSFSGCVLHERMWTLMTAVIEAT